MKQSLKLPIVIAAIAVVSVVAAAVGGGQQSDDVFDPTPGITINGGFGDEIAGDSIEGPNFFRRKGGVISITKTSTDFAIGSSASTSATFAVDPGLGLVTINGDLTITGTCTGCGGAGISSDSLDFDEFVNAMTLDANTSIASAGFGLSFFDTDLTINGALDTALSSGFVKADGSGILSGGNTIDLAADVTGVLPIANGGTNNSGAYTAGSVIFSNGTSLTQDNSNLFWDDSSNELGIGNLSPSAKLHVTDTGSTDREGILTEREGQTTGFGVDRTGSNYGVNFYVNGVKKLLIDGNAGVAIGDSFFGITPPDDGLVIEGFTGIGTSSPTTVLEVQGTASASYGLFNGGLQVGSFASTSYSRFGIGTTGHSLAASDDLLITGLFEVDDNAFFDANVTATGVIDFGSATSLEIPNSSGGTTVNAAGEVTIDTASSSFNFYDGTAERVIKAEKCFTYAFEAPTITEHWGNKKFFDPFTITSVGAIASGSNAVGWNMKHGLHGSITTDLFSADKSASSSAEGFYTSFNDATLADGEFLQLEIASPSATIENLDVTVCGQYDA